MATDDIVSLFQDSFQRCQAHPGFVEKFHDRFLASSAEVRHKFAGIGIARQKRMVSASLHKVVLASHAGAGAEFYLKKDAESPSRQHLEIAPELYSYWLQALLDTVEECDSLFDAEVKQAWIELTGHGIRCMTERYSKGPKTQSSKPDSTGT